MISREVFGVTPSGHTVHNFTLSNSSGMEVSIIEFGAIIKDIIVPDKDGNFGDVALGYCNLDGYVNDSPYFGATIGRSTGRIFPAELTVNGKSYPLDKNNGENNLHGGFKGLNKRIFLGEVIKENNEEKLVLKTVVPHLEDGFPGTLDVVVTFNLTEECQLDIEYYAVSSEDTMINLTNHSYFNLGGHNGGNIENHILQVSAPWYSAYSNTGVPEEIRKVDNTPFDFRSAKNLKSSFESEDQQIKTFNGIDNGFLLEGEGYRKVSELYCPETGRVMEVFTTETSLQVYTGNKTSVNENCKDGASYGLHDAICLETQNLPNSNHMPWLKSSIYPKGVAYNSKTSYKFSVR